MTNIDQDTLEKFWKSVEYIPFHPCWEWSAGKSEKGYGRIRLNSKMTKAHRVSWVIHNGSIPPERWVLHKCDNPGCVRIDHLFLGDHLLNMEDMCKKRRHRQHSKTHCKHGHEYTKENTIIYQKAKWVERICRACRSRY